MIRTKIPLGILLGLCCALTAAEAQTPPRTEASWQALTNEQSRGQLFKRYAAELLKANPGAGQSFALPYAFHFPQNAINDVDGKKRVDSIFGIDISHYEGNKFPLKNLKDQSISFIYIKATQGTDYADKTFDRNWNGVAGIPRGAYHFLSSDPKMSGKAQADSFVDYVNLHGKFAATDLPPAVDLEWDVTCQKCPDRWKTRNRSPQDIVGTAVDFMNRVKERTGRTPVLYTNKTFLNDNKITDPQLVSKLTTGFKVWIFDVDNHDRTLELPDPKKNLDHVLWQFSFGGSVPGPYSGDVDVEVFKGKPEDFNRIFTSND